jgi:hypothetical protein
MIKDAINRFMICLVPPLPVAGTPLILSPFGRVSPGNGNTDCNLWNYTFSLARHEQGRCDESSAALSNMVNAD